MCSLIVDEIVVCLRVVREHEDSIMTATTTDHHRNLVTELIIIVIIRGITISLERLSVRKPHRVKKKIETKKP